MMTYQEFHEAQEHNTKIVSKFLESGDFHKINEIKFWEKPNKLSIFTLALKLPDILGCCIIGAIPSILPNGADGYAYFNEEDGPQEIETKLTSVDLDSLVIGPQGGLYYTTPNMIARSTKPTGITSKISGMFDSNMSDATLETKARHTALVCVDREKNSVIDAWMLGPKDVVEELRKRKGTTNSPRMRISLAKFINRGWNIHTPVEKTGWSDWNSYVNAELTSIKKTV